MHNSEHIGVEVKYSDAPCMKRRCCAELPPPVRTTPAGSIIGPAMSLRSVSLKFAAALLLIRLVGACSKGTGSADPESPRGDAEEQASAPAAVEAEGVPTPDKTPDAPPPADAAPELTGKTCGARAGDTCTASEYCAYQPGKYCGAADAQATCKPRPEMCTRDYRPVCGCDNKTYGNACTAAAAGQGVLTEGECPPSPEDPVGE
jgi:hypothetical protein